MQISNVVTQLRKARALHHRECQRIDHALSVLGKPYRTNGTRELSAEARKKIGDAQRLRWSKTRKSATATVKQATQPIKVKKRKNTYWDNMTPTQKRNEMKRRGMLKK